MKNIFSIILIFSIFASNAQTKNIFDIARSGSLEEIKAAFKKNPESINEINENKSSTLILACYRGNIEVAKFLINNVKDLDYSSAMGTALMGAVYKNQLEIVKLILAKKPNVNFIDVNGNSALMLAVTNQHYEIVQELIKFNADLSIKDSKGKNALDYAIIYNDDKLIQILKTK